MSKSGKGKTGGANANGATIVLKRVEEGGHAHHGGAWKVAYADFVTAMMAFFLLMWLLNATTEEQRRGLADYFAPTNMMASAASGSGQPFGGHTPNSPGQMTADASTPRLERGPRPVLLDLDEDDSREVAEAAPRRDGPKGDDDDAVPRRVRAAPEGPPGQEQVGDTGPTGARLAPAAVDAARLSEAALRAELEQRERAAFEGVAEQIRAAVREDPNLADLARQLQIEQVPEGLRIQLLDAERNPMFALGGAAPNERARALLARVAQAIGRVPNPIAVTGHTDSTAFRGPERSNWDLSAERANTTRRLLVDAGVVDARMRSVSGLADRDLLLPQEPTAPANRRVAILLLRQAPGSGTDHQVRAAP